MFTGFTDETVDFMWGIRFNNERSWFEAHKEIYVKEFYEPMKELGDEVYEFLYLAFAFANAVNVDNPPEATHSLFKLITTPVLFPVVVSPDAILF